MSSQLNDTQLIQDRIARKAYELYEQRGYRHGHEKDDWFEAERLIFAELRSQIHNRAKTSQKKKTYSGTGGLQPV